MISEMLEIYRQRVENTLLEQLPQNDELLSQAMRYSTLNAGKRIRAGLIYATAQDFSIELDKVDLIAAALECIHAYSLIHDDLPAMDDDDLRRGKASLHKAFDEATAILAADALNTLAFELLAINDIDDHCKIKQIRMLASQAGSVGMVGGQSLDVLWTDQSITLLELENIHIRKTAALLVSCLHLPAMLDDNYKKYKQALDEIGQLMGLSYQILDDVLDVTADTQMLGKTAGKDTAQHKNTYVKMLGLDGSKALLNQKYAEILHLLQELPNQGKSLKTIIDGIFIRKY